MVTRSGRSRCTRRAVRAFSLLEMMLVLAIIGVLLAVVGLSLGGYAERGKIRATEASLKTLKQALTTYQVEYNAFPPTLAVLGAVRPPLIENPNMKDGWGREFYYKPGENAQGHPFTLMSFGGQEEYAPESAIDVWTIGS